MSTRPLPTSPAMPPKRCWGSLRVFLQGSATDATVLQRLHADMAAGRVFEGKAVNYRKDGSAFTMWWRVIPVIGSSGQPVCFVAFQREAHSS